MQNNKIKEVSFASDRMGRFIGQLRVHEGITLSQLSQGLCSVPFLNRIENGEQEVGKQMTDAFFQRLGKPVELFERILDWEEFQQWAHRQEIIASIRRGDIQTAKSGIQNYLSADSDVLDQQFTKIIEINCCYLSGADPKVLLPMVCDALALTQPGFQSTSVENLLLSQNEGRLLFAYLQLKEQLEGFDAVSESYNALLRYFKNPRYESRERVYLVPYVACRVIENDYNRGRYMSALTICEDALEELTKEKRLFAYGRLLEWNQKLYDAIGNPDKTPGKLLIQLETIQAYAPKSVELLIPCDERGHVYCLNQVIRDRRKLLGISQEALAEGICEPRTLSRIETRGGSLHRKNRRLLLQRVNMSGERYDYEVITDYYEDYLLRSDLDRAIRGGKHYEATQLLAQLRVRKSDFQANCQYIRMKELAMQSFLPEGDSNKLSIEEHISQLQIALHLTLPLELEQVDTWPTCVLSINEILILMAIAVGFKKQLKHEKSLKILRHIQQCLSNTQTDASFYEDLFTRLGVSIASTLNDLGFYEEAISLTSECMTLTLEHQHSERLTQQLYALSCNVNALIPDCSPEEYTKMHEKDISLLKSAYAAAIVSGDVAGQRFLENYSQRVYRLALEL